MNSLFFGPPATAQAAAVPESLDCPPVDIRSGTATITEYGPGEPNATNVRYQATIAQTARECAFLGATMTTKVGVQGRLIVGPVGGAARADIPLRIALVQEGPEPKTLWSKLYKVPVAIPPDQPSVAFVHVEEDLTVPKPKGSDLDAYVIYVGFDQMGQKKKPDRNAGPEYKERPLPGEGKAGGGRRGRRGR